ncbi:MAG: selenocysteine-specific translation elongation factor [Veillonellaceae bacterium]|nr:selenocysteine-specific translation elongation factor [Veillonellaceae bacterium]
MKYLIIGTAGHVDHGKSALIKALTGMDTDRLKEEKQRGISIDLGFASLNLADDLRAGIVDVPGHERFLKNMLAGTGGIDMAMLVIAADEGVMPQTKEHLAMLNLYGIKHGLVAINKIDKVDSEWLDLVEEEVCSELTGTFLANAPLCRVSALTGQGLDELQKNITMIARNLPARDSKAPFRLWVDRVFSVKGHGAVVTGSVLTGSAKTGDNLFLYPEGKPVRIRGLETHGSKVEEILAGQRAAINITGATLDEISRGMGLAVQDRGQTGTDWDVIVDWHEEVPSGTRIRLHLGTGEHLGRIYSFKDAGSRYMRLLLEAPLYAAAGDRGIVRLYSPQHLVGGAMIIAPGTNSRKLSANRIMLADALCRQSWQEVILANLLEQRRLVDKKGLLAQMGFIRESIVEQSLAKMLTAGQVKKISEYYMALPVLEKMTDNTKLLLTDYHSRFPDKSGISREAVKQRLAVADNKSFDVLAGHWVDTGLIAADGAEWALKTHAEKHGGWLEALTSQAESLLADVGLTNINEAVIMEKFKLEPDKAKAVRAALVKQGMLIKVGDMHVYSKTIQYIIGLLKQHFANKPSLTVGELRDMLNTTRKVALPLLEYFDMHKYTVRDGDVRRPGQCILYLSE